MDSLKNLSQYNNLIYFFLFLADKLLSNAKEILENFFKFYDSYYNMINDLEKKQSISTKKHPWFVNFNNFDL